MRFEQSSFFVDPSQYLLRCEVATRYRPFPNSLRTMRLHSQNLARNYACARPRAGVNMSESSPRHRCREICCKGGVVLQNSSSIRTAFGKPTMKILSLLD